MSALLPLPAPPTLGIDHQAASSRWRPQFGEAAALATVFLVADALRLPYLWQIPRFTDELQEILWSLSIVRGEMLPLTAVDSYYGPVWSYLLAAAFMLFGPSAELPRLVALVAQSSFVVLTYLFSRDDAGRWPATIAAGLLLPLVAGSIMAVLPYFNPSHGPILSGRYLIPLLPLLFTAAGCSVVVLARWTASLLSGSRRGLEWRLLAVLAGGTTVLYPLLPLAAYYRDAVADGRTNQSLFRLVDSVASTRQTDELVLLDEGLAQKQLGAGGTDLKAPRMLLSVHGVPNDVAKISDLDDGRLDRRATVLIIMEAKKRTALPRGIRSTVLSPDVPSASGSEHRYALFRLTGP